MSGVFDRLCSVQLWNRTEILQNLISIPKTKNIGTEKHSRHNETTNASKYIKRPLFLSGLDHKLLERLAPEKTMLKL